MKLILAALAGGIIAWAVLRRGHLSQPARPTFSYLELFTVPLPNQQSVTVGPPTPNTPAWTYTAQTH